MLTQNHKFTNLLEIFKQNNTNKNLMGGEKERQILLDLNEQADVFVLSM